MKVLAILINYMYLHDDENEDLKININLFDDTKYNLEILFNEKHFNSYNISKSFSSVLSAQNDLKDNFNNNQPCKINFIVQPQNLNTNSTNNY